MAFDTPTTGEGSIVPVVYRVSEVARLLQLGRSSTYRLIQSGELPSIRVGRSVRVLRADFDAYLERAAA
jgi:excisionase family DNA binding protein